jgi:tyrosyl-tRNA synthetase
MIHDFQELLTRGVKEVIEKNHLTAALASKKKLRVKLGIDPTGADLHLGHAVPLWKLRKFQEAGHRAVFIIGDWTAMIGDPSGKDKTRVGLTEKQIKENSKHYFDQASKVLDKQKTEVHLQSEWFKRFGLKEVIHLESLVTEKQILAHETFRQRIEKDLPFLHHETLYPLLQGYDSVAVKADVELGALEQKFNLLMGRTVQKAFGQEQQDIIIMPYLIGLDGKEKMSKTLNNYISLMDSADEMFGKAMSLPDSLIKHYFELCTEVPESEIWEIMRDHPKTQKVRLAKEVITIYHSAKAASAAEDEFNRKFGKGKGKIKADLEIRVHSEINVIDEVLVQGGLAASKSEAGRKVKEGAVEVDGKKVTNPKARVKLIKGGLIRLGKRFLRII